MNINRYLSDDKNEQGLSLSSTNFSPVNYRFPKSIKAYYQGKNMLFSLNQYP